MHTGVFSARQSWWDGEWWVGEGGRMDVPVCQMKLKHGQGLLCESRTCKVTW